MEHNPNWDREDNILMDIHEGMEVYDLDGETVGTVEFVHFGATDAQERELGTGPATISDIESPAEGSLIDAIEDAFGGEEMVELVRDRLLQEGFIRIDSPGLFGKDRYVTRDHIQSVAGDRVNLNVTKDDLITD